MNIRHRTSCYADNNLANILLGADIWGGNRLAGPDIRTESDRGSQRVIECIFRCNRYKTSIRTRHDDTRNKGDKPDSDDRGYNTKHTKRRVRHMMTTMQILERKRIQNPNLQRYNEAQPEHIKHASLFSIEQSTCASSSSPSLCLCRAAANSGSVTDGSAMPLISASPR
jgi:hypothetical protein